ncbi:hypothetical protein GCM10009865_42280 [Aeromicrobium ponti]|uniref:ABC-2 type transport system ATP-binding protein n=1 Tax=Cytobacillus oceanisediminis TaxID=665099 RepID=A0A562JFY0_9BACI|nr:ABC transporter ATP-binding protein [Cytobacillus oceanisediminis]TWH81983.1 ABC-2 type transport system ATP-binding protein [Cytobacillus oceanisediminis]
MIEIKELTQFYGKKIVLDHVNLTIETNEICALVGRNGAGKSTLINSLLGIIPVKKGIVKINGLKFSKRNSGDIAFLPEKFMLYPPLSGLENMTFFALASLKTVDMVRIRELLESVSLWEDRHLAIKNYSKGMLQRLGLAITLYQDSGILILDEPTSGIDPMGRKEILQILKSLEGKTILLSSHHLDEIRQLCTHVAYLEDCTIQKFTVDEFLETQRLGDNAL